MSTAWVGGFLERQNRVPVDEKALLVTLAVLGWVGVAVGLARGTPLDVAGVIFFGFVIVLTGGTAVLAVARWRLGPATDHREPRGWRWRRRQPPAVRYTISVLWLAMTVLFSSLVLRS